MKLRYRKPSVKRMLGVTKAKRQVKKSLGVDKITRVTNAPKNIERRSKRKVGYESEPMKLFRFLGRLFK